MRKLKWILIVGSLLSLIGCASSGRPADPNRPSVYDHVQHFSTRDAFKELLMTHQPSDKELKAREALRIYLQQFDNYGFVHSESPAPSHVNYDAYINEHGKPTFRFSYAYFSEKHDGIVLVSLWDDPENRSPRPRNVVKNIKDEYELTIPTNNFCSSNFNAKELSEELTDVLQGLSPGRKSKLMDIQRRESVKGSWAFHPGAFRLGNDASIDSVANIVSNIHMTFVEYYYYVYKREMSKRRDATAWGKVRPFELVSGCLLKTNRLNLVNKLTSI